MYILSFDVGIKNLAYCLIDTESVNIHAWEVFEIPNPAISLHKVLQLLDTKELCILTDIILIEKQPYRNAKMRLLENILLTYFNLRGIMCSNSPVTNVKSYSAKFKLGDIGKTMKGKKNYNQRKKMSIEMCKLFLEKNPQELNDIFIKSKKKDDLADCLLQALSYIEYKI